MRNAKVERCSLHGRGLYICVRAAIKAGAAQGCKLDSAIVEQGSGWRIRGTIVIVK